MKRRFIDLSLMILALLSPASVVYAQGVSSGVTTTGASSSPRELDLWQSAQRDNTAQAYQNYLTRFPNGAFSTLAASRAPNPLLTDLLPVPPEAEDEVVQAEVAAARTAWDNAAWTRVKAANTHSAYREYLLYLPIGLHADEALAAYRASLPVPATLRLPDCVARDHEATRIGPGFNTARAFPEAAITNWTGGIVIMRSHLDYTGQPLSLTIDYASDPLMFSRPARKVASQMRYNPAVSNCAQIADSAGLMIAYHTGDLPFESRQNSEDPALTATVNTKFNGRLPGDRAVLIMFKPAAGQSVYQIDFQSRFPPLLTQVVEGRATPLPLVNNKLFVVSSDAPITLRVSSRDKPNSRTQNMGAFNFTIRQVFNQPAPEVVR